MKNKLNKTIALSLLFTTALPFTGCVVKSPEDASSSILSASVTASSEALEGGWYINRGMLSIGDNLDAKQAFQKVEDELLGYHYNPVALLATVDVEGTDYAILCEEMTDSDDVTTPASWDIIYIYQELGEDPDAHLLGKTHVDLKTEEDAPLSDAKTFDESYTPWQSSTSLTSDQIEAAMDIASFEADDADEIAYEPVAVLGHRDAVPFVQYAVFCRLTSEETDDTPRFAVVYVATANGNEEVTSTEEVLIEMPDDAYAY
ncbi:MAG: hypothetical protein U0L49_00450 [Eubacterium sp.]|nr:hypothetical protein [Eubacterium sp.]